ncbi:flavin-containing monooxygenase [Nocardia noduli]|uniref:flavin-containing monooxygenase n=1 Tax=Nocardia noduli TaxID=2815722 RepID=UPI001C222753|nr:NAD(P)/FAD-dependent oxidoreductase [Nocardia noduli]
MSQQLSDVVDVAIIGAGFAGIGMAVGLREDGITDFAIFDKGDIGGVWRDNTYPGCRCDVPSHLYSFSFAPYRGRLRYPDQPAILDYLHQVVERFDLTPHLRLGTAIEAARYDDATGTWTLTTTGGARIGARTVVFAVGLLHRPHIPVLPGLDRFTGAAWHSARWDHSVELAGRDIAVVGTGASAVGFIPELAERARSVTVYQRTPTWVLPKPGPRFGRLTGAAMKYLPGMHALYRSAIFRGADLVLAPIMTGGWSARPARWLARAHLRRQVADVRLRAALTPEHRLGAKRILLSSDYYRALSRENVELVTAGIEEITADAVRTTDGRVRRADVLVCATGFRASEFLAPIRIFGRGGRDLHRSWAGGAEAVLGTAVAGFPNMFLIAGPSTFLSSGSNIGGKQAQIGLIRAALAWREKTGALAIEPSTEAMSQYRGWLDRKLSSTVWPDGGPSWYKTEQGRTIAPWPGTAAAFARACRRDPATIFVPAPTPVPVPDAGVDRGAAAVGVPR